MFDFRRENMKKKLTLMMMSFAFALLALPMVGHASEADAKEIKTYEELVTAAKTGGEYKLTADITMVGQKPIEVTKSMVLYGGDHTIDGTDMVRSETGNGSIITAHEGTVVELYGLKLKNANKYGVHAYNGGTVSVHGVIIENCKYGAVLVNGGSLVVGDLSMKDNGEHPGGNGIEIGKGSDVTYDPVISVVGNVTVEAGTQTNAIALAENDNLTTVSIVNVEGALNTLAIEDGKLVIKDENGATKYESNKPANKEITLVDETDIEEPTPTPIPNPGDTETPADEVAAENPNTYDGILGYVTLAVLGVCALAFGEKKAFSK